MDVKYNVQGKERKALVEAIAKATEEEFKYLGVPSCTYQIGAHFQVDRAGTLVIDDFTDSENVEHLLETLEAQGFTFEAAKTPDTENERHEEMPVEDAEPLEETTEAAAPEPYEEPDRLTIEIPSEGLDGNVLQNLEKIIASKASLIQKALGADRLSYEVTDSSVKFPWFTLDGGEGEANAYAQFATALVQMAKESKRITAKPKEVENEKFAFRVFLIRLGLVGDDFKLARKLLLKNLEGNSAFKGGARNVSKQSNSQSSEDAIS
jgi:hypothetical protein